MYAVLRAVVCLGLIGFAASPAQAQALPPPWTSTDLGAPDAAGSASESGGTFSSATASPYSFTWSDVPAGTYSLTAIARDDDGAATTSAAVSITVSATPPPPPPPTTSVAFTASPDHDTLVTSYTVAIYRADDPVSGTPVAAKDLGRPTPANGDITVDISDIVNPLASGSYYAVVSAVGSAGTSTSAPSTNFTK